MGSMLEIGPADGSVRRRLYISGDTLLVEELDEIPVRFEAIDAGIVHLGGTRLPAGNRLPFGLTVTMDGRQGTDLVDKLKLPKVIPVHFDDYPVFASPLTDFVAEMTAARHGRSGDRGGPWRLRDDLSPTTRCTPRGSAAEIRDHRVQARRLLGQLVR